MTLPRMMNAVEISTPGAPEALRMVSRPLPPLGPGEVLIRVAAAGINRPDVLQRQGHYPPPPGVTDIPGLEVAGEVVDAAADVTTPRIGEQVCALLAGGGYAEYAVAPAVQCLPVPAGMTLEQAACLPETFFTVWLNVFERARLDAGETLLVHGGASGIGTTAILLGVAFGAKVMVTAGSDSRCEACLALGASQAINYHAADFVARVREATQGHGADVILDMVGGDYVPRNIEAAAVEGRIALIAVQGGTRAQIDLRQLLVKRLQLMGATLRPQTVARKGALARALHQRVWPLFAAGKLAPPPVHERFALADAARAHALMEGGSHVGKIVLLA